MIYSFHTYRSCDTHAAWCAEFPGLMATGATRDEALAALNAMIEAALMEEQPDTQMEFELGEPAL